MTVSELIVFLEHELATIGDVDVIHVDGDGDRFPLCEDEFSVEGNTQTDTKELVIN